MDLTRAVADEAIERRDSIVVAYHPIIFRGLKSLSLDNPQQETLLRLSRAGISVYSPHTALDAAKNGMCDWLCRMLTVDDATNPETPSTSGNYSPYLVQSCVPIEPLAETDAPVNHHGAGMGRLLTFSEAQSLTLIRDRLLKNTGLSAAPLAIPQAATNTATIGVKTVGVCPGSGASLLIRKGAPIADLLVTGELSHHDALAAIERGSSVISLFHSNTERGFVGGPLREALDAELRKTWPLWLEEAKEADIQVDQFERGMFDVAVSAVDRDPYRISVLGDD